VWVCLPDEIFFLFISSGWLTHFRNKIMDISIRDLLYDDLDIADGIVTSAFGLTGSRIREIRRYFSLEPNRWFLATYRDQPAGVVGATNYGPFTYLGMMTVRKELQRKGIGQAMLQHMLNWTESEGISFLRLDASDAGFPLYLRFGFEVLDQALMFQPADYMPASNFPQQVRPLEFQDIQALADFDSPIFGANRAGLFQALLTDFPDRAFAVYDASGDMAGYLIAQTRRLGPWAARSPRDAEALLRAALTLTYKGIPLAIAPATNTTASDLLGRHGFRCVSTNRHMQRGRSDIPGRRTAIYGQTSFAVG
jgi:GNAT superfamily N-acetyltransferase